jgi:outer membrane receptor protein involved in Fe transport
MAQKNIPRALEELLPAYENNSWAISIFEQATFDSGGVDDRWLLNCALRYDTKHLAVFPDITRRHSNGIRKNWKTVSASAGLLYRISEQISLAGNLSTGWRAPSEFELFVNGIHGGVATIQRGDPNLQVETNLNSEVSLRWSLSHIRGYITLFNNDFDDYIYLANTGKLYEGLPIFGHRQTDAYLRGMEANLEIALSEWVHTSVGFDYLNTKNRANFRKLPLTPPSRLTWAFRLKNRRNPLESCAEIKSVWSGNGRTAGPEEPFSFSTDSYLVLELSAATSTNLNVRASLSLDLIVHNLFNSEYRDFLYTYKGVADMPGRDVRLVARLRF